MARRQDAAQGDMVAHASALLAKYTAVRTCAVEKTGQRPLIDALLKAGGQNNTIARIIETEYPGTKLRDQAVGRHKRGDCTCQKR